MYKACSVNMNHRLATTSFIMLDAPASRPSGRAEN